MSDNSLRPDDPHFHKNPCAHTLNRSTKDAINTTLPIFRSHSKQIALQLYANLFSQHPELKAMFSTDFLQTRAQCQTNPGFGMSVQAQLLSDSIISLCSSIDNVESTKILQRISLKHISRHVQPDYYKAVATAFCESTRSVLADKLMESELKAWELTVTALCGLLIDKEKDLYALLNKNGSHWEGFRSFSVQAGESKCLPGRMLRKRYSFHAKDGAVVPKSTAGEFICLRAEHEEYGMVHCNITLASGSKRNELSTLMVASESQGSNGTSNSCLAMQIMEERKMVELSSPISALLQTNREGKRSQRKTMQAGVAPLGNASPLANTIVFARKR